MAQCPKCDTVLAHVDLEGVSVRSAAGRSWHGVLYSCPYCSATLSVGIDPVALKADVVSETVAKTLEGIAEQLEKHLGHNPSQ
jgi:hypothetical protein